MGGTFWRIAGACGVSWMLACGAADSDADLDPGSGSSSSGGGLSSSSSGAAAQTVTLTGTAAVGAPIAAATVTAKCADGSGFLGTVVSGAQGAWAGTVAQSALPCALQITSANPALTLHGFVTAPGVANLTPLTDLILALAAAQLPVDWYASANWQNVATAVGAATARFQQALVAAGYPLPPGPFAPFTTAFIAAPGDPWDQLLEALAAALAAHRSSGGYAGLLAQLAAGNTSALPAADGPLAGRNGITGRAGATTHTFVDGVSYSSVIGVVSAHASDGAGGFDALTRWAISGVPSALGTYACKSGADGILPKIELQVAGVYSGTPPTGGSCSIDVTRVAPDEIEGRFTATLVGTDGVTTTAVTDGYFRKVKSDDGGGQPLGPTEAGASFVAEGRTYRYALATNLAYEVFAGVTLQPNSENSPGSPLGIQLHTIPNAPGTYACDSGSNAYRKLNAWFYWHGEMYTAGSRVSPDPQPAGSSCSITVTDVGTMVGGNYLGTFAGTFSGTFVSADGARSVVVTDGKFRLLAGEAPAIQPALEPLIGTQNPVVLSGGQNFGTTDGATMPITVDADGTVHVGVNRVFSGYSFLNLNESYYAEPNYRLTLPDVDGHTGPQLAIYMDGSTPVGYRVTEFRTVETTLVSYELAMAFRPISQAMLDKMTALYALKDTVLTKLTAVVGPACETHTVTGSATLTITNPYLQMGMPGVYDTWGDPSARLGMDGGVPTLTSYYSRYYFPAAGIVDFHPLGGNHQDYGEVWSNDPVRIAATCTP